jgi:hypothetical protein
LGGQESCLPIRWEGRRATPVQRPFVHSTSWQEADLQEQRVQSYHQVSASSARWLHGLQATGLRWPSGSWFVSDRGSARLIQPSNAGAHRRSPRSFSPQNLQRAGGCNLGVADRRDLLSSTSPIGIDADRLTTESSSTVEVRVLAMPNRLEGRQGPSCGGSPE